MASSGGSRSCADMGQNSSQLQKPSAEPSAPEHQRKSKDKKGKLKKSREQSAEMERPIAQVEAESAHTLLQIRNAQVQDSRAPYYEDSHALPEQLRANNSPMRPSAEPVRKSKNRKTNDKRAMKKRTRTDIYEYAGSEEHSNGVEQYPDLPSTPPRQIDRSSPPPYRPAVPAVNALDDIPTDDDDVAAYEEYAKDTASADPPGLSDHDVFSFSQQPPNPFDQDEVGEGMHATYQLPTNVYGSSQSNQKQKQKKRKRRMNDQGDIVSSAHDQGQYISYFDSQAIDHFLKTDMSLANLFCRYKVHDMPIDPELHNVNTLPPSAELSNLNGEDLNILQKNGGYSDRRGSSQPRKRRWLEELRDTSASELPYMSPYSFQHEQENIQDQVLPGFEDMQKQASGPDSPFPDNVTDGDSNLSGDGVQAKKSAVRKKNGEPRKARPKKERGDSQKGDEIERATKDKADNGGAFSVAEGLQLDAFRDNYCEANDMTVWQFNNLIQSPMRGNAQVKALFNEIHDILPYRPRMSVQKCCRRRFHNFSRGTWNAEEDEVLKQAVAEKGKAWKEIGDLMGRMSEDCRDRWRNYLVNSEHRNREQWTDAEVVNLCTAILECMQLMKEDRMRARGEGEDVPECGTESDQEREDMKHINWQAVSDRMGEHGGGRSRLQCSFKWGQLRKREQADYLKSIRDSGEIEKKRPTPVKNPWRMKLASKRVDNMRSGDIHALLQAVADLDVPEEGNIPWKSLGDDKFRATWTSTDKKAAWSRLKERVAGSEFMDYCRVANELLSRIISEDPDALNERWDPQLHGDVSAKKTRKKRKAAKQTDKGKGKEDSDPTNGYLQRSNEFVYDSDDMDGNAGDQTRLGGFEPQDYNPYNVLPMSDGMDGVLNPSNGVGPMTTDDQEAFFHDGSNANGHLSMADGEVSPEFAGRLQSALNAALT